MENNIKKCLCIFILFFCLYGNSAFSMEPGNPQGFKKKTNNPGSVEPTTKNIDDAASTVYYIDYDGGNDSADGLSAETAWRHSPGDNNALETSASTPLEAGNTVIFKGGVHYRGQITCQSSGSEGNRIIYDGNTAGSFGSGKAIIDGADPSTGWTKCVSASDCGGNPNWQHIYKTVVPEDINVFTANLYENDAMLWPAQKPNLADPFYPDDLTTFSSIQYENVTRTSVTDPNFFTQNDPNFYTGSYLRLWGNPNRVRIIPITGYIPAENKVTFADTGENSLYTNKEIKYAVANHIFHLDVPGEFSVNETTHTAYLWPLTPGDPNLQEISMSTRPYGIYLNGQDYITIQGLKLQKSTGGPKGFFSGCGILDRKGGSNITIKNNEVTRNYSLERQGALRISGGGTNVLIENNNIHLNPHNRGIIFTAHNSIVRKNILHKNGGTAVDFYSCINSQLINNTVTEHTGGHANGLTLYLGNKDCLVAYNTVYDGNVALTIQDATNITVAYNILHTAKDDTYTAMNWDSAGTHVSDGLYYYNNIILNPQKKGLGVGKNTTNLIVRNNIIDGFLGGGGDHISYNIYTSLAWNQADKYNWSLGERESTESDKAVIFADPEKRDFHLASGSPAIGAGIDVNQTRDHDGTILPKGVAPDIGAYQF